MIRNITVIPQSFPSLPTSTGVANTPASRVMKLLGPITNRDAGDFALKVTLIRRRHTSHAHERAEIQEREG